jgi:lipopolysaccharide export system protein LptC
VARSDTRYSRLVAFLKVVLPLAALALLSTLFLLSRGGDERAGLPVGRITAEGEMQDFRYTARVEDGALTFTGRSATPRAARYDRVEVGGPRAVLERDAGGVTDVTAETGMLDNRSKEVELTGEVRVATSEGWVLRTAYLRSAFDGAWAESPGPVTVTGPGLDLEAGAMRLEEGTTGTPAGRVLFKGGVRLVYTPQSE